MKKLLLYLVIVLLAILISCELDEGSGGTDPTDPDTDKEITVTTPKSGDSLAIGGSFLISWVSNTTEKINIDFTTDSGISWLNIASGLTDLGSYVWNPIPNTVSDGCKVRVMTTDSTVVGVSDGAFSIVPMGEGVKSLGLIRPNGGELLVVGSEFIVHWTSTLVANISLELSTDNGNTWITIVDSYQAETSQYTWSPIPNIPSSECLIRIKDIADAAILDISNAAFIISDAKELIVTAPNGGESWISNSAYMITWFSSQVANVSIDYTTNNGVSWTSIASNVPSNGLYQWEPVPNTPSNNAKIRITNIDGGFPTDESNGVFSITPEEYIRVVHPNGGENFQAGSAQYITWQSSIPGSAMVDQPGAGGAALTKSGKVYKKSKILKKGKSGSFTDTELNKNGGNEVLAINSVKIEYSTNNGANWTLITESTPNNGTFLWSEVPAENSSLCIVRISDADDNMPFDISDASFQISDATVLEQVIRLIAPNGGEVFEAGTTQNITWAASSIENFDLEFSIDNGNTWNIIATSVQGAAFEWRLPLDLNSPITKVRVSDNEDGLPFDESDGNFTVRPAESITVISPTAGEVYDAGQPILIEWIATGIENVGIQYTTTNGLGSFEEPPFYTVTPSTPNTGSLETSFSIPSNGYYVTVYDATDAAPLARSIGTFSVTGQVFGSITVLKPATGDSLYGGTTEEIKWTSEYVENIKIEFSQNFGATWETIVESTPSDGSYMWDPVPQITSDLCALRMSNVLKSEVSGTSPGPFVIAEQAQQIAGEPASIYLVSQTFSSIGVTESGSPETSQITFEIQDSSGLPIDFAHSVNVSFRFGARPGGGEFLAPTISPTDDKGRVNVNLSSGTIAGSVQVIAEIDYEGDIIRSRPVNIAIHGGLPNSDHFAIGSDQSNYAYYNILNGSSTVTAVVGDQYSNPVKQGTVVYFSTEGGIIEGSSLTDNLGRATVTLISGSPLPNDPVFGEGFFWVTGHTIDENDSQISANVRVLYSGDPVVTILPRTFNIPNGGSVSFTYTIVDINNNPLAPTNRYTVIIETAGDAQASGATFFVMPDTQTGYTTFGFTVSDSTPDEVKPASISVSVKTEGPNDIGEDTVFGTTN